MVPRLDATHDRLLIVWKAPESARVSESIELGVNVVGLLLSADRVAVVRKIGRAHV